MRPLELLDIDAMHSEEELAVRDVVRRLADERVRPSIADWYERGTVPVRELAEEFGKVGLLGMHLTGYGCAGASAVAYGLACLELEAADSGVRSLVSVQGSLAMFGIWRFGSEEQKQQWLPRMASGEAIGCFGLTEPDHGSDPASMKTTARRDGEDWVLNGTKMWITNAPVADVAVIWARTADDIAGFVVPMDTPGVTAREVHHKLSLRASSTGEIALDEVRLPAGCRRRAGSRVRCPA
jgi:glutaryl-CoA dehydrogenase